MVDPNLPEVTDAHGYVVTPAHVLEAYMQRMFPMSEDRDGPLAWYRPLERAIITWDRWQVPRSMRKVWNKQPYRLSIDEAFPLVIQACADRDSTWIGKDIECLYLALHELGIAHSVEAWDGDDLVGGLYGLSLGAVFCGESMFHRANDASKLAAMHLVNHLQKRGFGLLDCQQQTPHMQRFGAYEVNDAEYQELFEANLVKDVSF